MFKVHARRIVVFIMLGFGVALFYALSMPKLYQATGQVLVQQADPKRMNVGEEVARMLSTGYASGLDTEMAVLNSPLFFESVVQDLRRTNPAYATVLSNTEELYGHYRAGTGGSLVQVDAKASSPEAAELIVTGILDRYQKLTEENAANSVSTSIRWLEAREKETKDRLGAVENEIRQFREQHKLVSAEGETTKIAGYVASLEQQRDATQTELRQLEAQIATQRSKMRLLPTFRRQTYSVEKTPIVAGLEGQIANLQTQRLVALKDYREDSQRVKSIDQLIANLESQLVKERARQWQENTQQYGEDPIRSRFEGELAQAEVTRRSLQARLSQATNLLGEQQRLMAGMPALELKYTQMLRERAQLERTYGNMKSQLEDMKIKAQSTLGAAQPFMPATAKPEPVAPDVSKMAIFGAIAGACLGLLFSFLFEALRLPVRSSSQLTELTGLPVAATVPLMPRRRARNLLAALPSPDAKPSESFRFMAFSQLAREGGAPKIVMFTGIGGTVGCSSAAGQFALATAQTGVRTLLVDCDLRHPALTTAFEVNDKSGLSDMLNRTMLASDSVDLSVETVHDHLRVVPAGTDSGQTSGLAEFPTSHIVGIIENFKERADVIVLDAPPCDVVSDASRLVPYVDQVNLVISAASTSFRSVPIAYELLRRAGAKEINMILTHASPQDEPFTKRSKYLVSSR